MVPRPSVPYHPQGLLMESKPKDTRVHLPRQRNGHLFGCVLLLCVECVNYFLLGASLRLLRIRSSGDRVCRVSRKEAPWCAPIVGALLVISSTDPQATDCGCELNCWKKNQIVQTLKILANCRLKNNSSQLQSSAIPLETGQKRLKS